MQLTPRYGSAPVITLDGPPSAIVEPATRQRHRLVDAMAAFGDRDWAHPSRCDGWTNRDVIVHLDGTNAFWAFSITAALQGEPTRFLANFDPVASPAELVAGSHGIPNSQVMDQFQASTTALVDLLSSLDEASWSELAEAPPGHISVSAVVHHALWDSWIHERDILLPLGVTTTEEPDEITACLRYAAALAPALSITQGSTRRGLLNVVATGLQPSTDLPTNDPIDRSSDLRIIVEIGDCAAVTSGGSARADLTLTGDAVELLEAFSIRRPLDHAVPADSAWMIAGISEIFEVDPS